MKKSIQANDGQNAVAVWNEFVLFHDTHRTAFGAEHFVDKRLWHGKTLTVGCDHERIRNRQCQGKGHGETGSFAEFCSKRQCTAEFVDGAFHYVHADAAPTLQIGRLDRKSTRLN